MKAIHYLLSFFLLFVWACGPSDSTGMDLDPEPDDECFDEDAFQVANCKLALSKWVVGSVRSDVARPIAGGSTRDWMDFDLPCREGAILEFSAFGFLPSDSITNGPIVFNRDESCGFPEIQVELVADESFRECTFYYDKEYSVMVYGIEVGFLDDRRERWYDITFDRDEFFRYTVDKTYEGVNYVVEVELLPFEE